VPLNPKQTNKQTVCPCYIVCNIWRTAAAVTHRCIVAVNNKLKLETHPLLVSPLLTHT